MSQLSQVVGSGKTPVIDTWWQTETGAHMITPLPGATPLKPGWATLPFFGVEPVLLDDKARHQEIPFFASLFTKRVMYLEGMQALAQAALQLWTLRDRQKVFRTSFDRYTLVGESKVL